MRAANNSPTRRGDPRGISSLVDPELLLEDDPSASRRYGRIAGILFIAGGLAGTPAMALHEPGFPATIYLFTALALLSGALCLAVPWERISPRWLHAVGVVASLEVFAISVLIAAVFCWYYVLIAVWAAYVFGSRLEVGAQLGLAATLMFGAAALDGGEQVVRMLVAVPALLAATGLVWALREQLERREAGYRLLSRRDPLTGAGNYRELHDALALEETRHRVTGAHFALILLDLDRFKEVNDRHGHLEGDRVLREVAAVLSETVRGGDVVARHGGDEFSVVAAATGERDAAELASRLRDSISRLAVGDNLVRGCTGTAIFPDDGYDSDSLLAVADSRLKEAKLTLDATEGLPSAR